MIIRLTAKLLTAQKLNTQCLIVGWTNGNRRSFRWRYFWFWSNNCKDYQRRRRSSV